MVNQNGKYPERVAALLVIFGVVLFKWFDYFRFPSKLLPSGGDGTKNYFTFLYHVKHDKSYWKFDGMNYPYGENIVFTDNQPILSVFIKWLHSVIGFSDGTLIGLHNWAILFGLALGSTGIFYVFRKLNTSILFALFCTIGLMFLQPQLDRLQSHYSMVYPFLPWVFYGWLHIWDQNKTNKYSLIISILVLVGGLLHMYHFLTMAVFIVFAGCLYLVQKRNINGLVSVSLMWAVQIILPFVILYCITNFILPVPDRPVKVWGFFSYHSAWEGLFFSYKLPLFHYINENLFKIRTLDHIEGVNYIGFVSVAFVLIAIPVLLNQLVLKKTKNFSWTPRTNLSVIFVVSALISFGFPFTIKGMEWLLDYTGPFQQFRSIGRIGWISFYAINFISLSWLYEKISSWNNKLFVYVTLLVVGSIPFYEGYKTIPLNQNPTELQGAFAGKVGDIPINTKLYQAILPDPYLHVGSECYSWGPSGGNQDQAFEIGYALALPSMSGVMSRTSLRQSTLLNQLVCKPYEVPEIITLIKAKDPRPILVLESTLNLWSRNSSLSHWTKGTKIVYEGNEFRLRELPLSHFDTIVKNFQDSIRQIEVDTIFSEHLDFQHSRKEKSWGYEAILYCDSLSRGDASITFEIDFKENTDINSITEVWQITKEHQNAEQFSVRNNYHYTRIKDNLLFITVPVHIKPETHKIAIRISKDRQKEKDPIFFRNPKLVMVSVNQNK